MECKQVFPLLSEYIDEELDADAAVNVSQHLHQCVSCRTEHDALLAIQSSVQSLRGVQAPEFLSSLVQHRIVELKRNTLRNTLRNELERYWSLIRTTERIWYVTRALGTVMTAIIFVLISSTAISPLCLEADAKSEERDALSCAYRKHLSNNVLANLGMEASRTSQQPQIPISRNNPALNSMYYVIFEEGNASTGKEDTVTVVTTIDPSGAARIQNVLEYPKDKNLLIKYNEMIASAKYRPASLNGKAVPSNVIMMYSTVSVSE